MAGKNDGGFSVYEPPARSGAQRNDGGFSTFVPGAPSPGNNGGFRVYGQDAPPRRPAEQPQSRPLATPPSRAALLLGAGSKARLRRGLELTLVAIQAFCLEFFDALVTESSATTGPAMGGGPVWEEGGHESFGFRFEEDEGAIIVTGILGGSPAERGGLKVGDQVLTVDDGIKPESIAHFAEAWKRGAKWDSYKLQVRRNGARVHLDIPRA